MNWLILLFGLFSIGLGTYSLVIYGDAGDAFFSKQSYALLIIGGLLTFVLVWLACSGGRDPKTRPNYLFCYWCIASLILIFNIFGFYFFRLFIRGVQDAAEDSEAGVISVVETQVAKQFQDFVLSTYTACCTGCDANIAVLSCIAGGIDAFAVTGENFCETVAVAGSVGSEDADCVFAEICSADVLTEAESNDGVGLGCYTSAFEIPSFPIGSDSCALMTTFTIDGEPLVGPSSNGLSCGGGVPQAHLDNFLTYFDGVFLLVAVPWGLFITLLSMTWLASLYLILFPGCARTPDDTK